MIILVHTFEQIYLQGQRADFCQSISLASLGWGKGCIRFWGRLAQNCGYHGNRKLPLTYNGKNTVSVFSQSPLIRPLSNLQVMRTGIKSRMSLNLGQVGLFTMELSSLSIPIYFEWGKWCLHLFLVTMNSVFIKPTGNKNRYKILVKFRFRSYLTSHFEITCPWEKMMSPTFLNHLWLDLCQTCR